MFDATTKSKREESPIDKNEPIEGIEKHITVNVVASLPTLASPEPKKKTALQLPEP